MSLRSLLPATLLLAGTCVPAHATTYCDFVAPFVQTQLFPKATGLTNQSSFTGCVVKFQLDGARWEVAFQRELRNEDSGLSYDLWVAGNTSGTKKVLVGDYSGWYREIEGVTIVGREYDILKVSVHSSWKGDENRSLAMTDRLLRANLPTITSRGYGVDPFVSQFRQ